VLRKSSDHRLQLGQQDILFKGILGASEWWKPSTATSKPFFEGVVATKTSPTCCSRPNAWRSPRPNSSFFRKQPKMRVSTNSCAEPIIYQGFGFLTQSLHQQPKDNLFTVVVLPGRDATLLSCRETRTRHKVACPSRTECAAKRASSLYTLAPGARVMREKGIVATASDDGRRTSRSGFSRVGHEHWPASDDVLPGSSIQAASKTSVRFASGAGRAIHAGSRMRNRSAASGNGKRLCLFESGR